MNVKWEQQPDGATVARVEGRIDSANFAAFQRTLEAGLAPDARTVIVNFEQVAFISSAGLRVVLMLGKQLRKRGAQLALCSLKHPVREIFSVSGFDRLIPIHGSETQALDALANDPQLETKQRERLRNEIDFDIVGDNLKDIAAFTVEKYEFINNCALSGEARQRALEGINDALWRCVEESKRERLVILKKMFLAAEYALDDVLGPSND